MYNQRHNSSCNSYDYKQNKCSAGYESQINKDDCCIKGIRETLITIQNFVNNVKDIPGFGIGIAITLTTGLEYEFNIAQETLYSLEIGIASIAVNLRYINICQSFDGLFNLSSSKK